MYNSEAYEMKKYHKLVLTHTRLYILHNLRPSELLWSSLLAKEVLSHEMVAEIKLCGTNNQQVAALLDVLPARGPGAFDAFCETLLECDHVHVAEHLKTLEATDQFREDILKHAGPDLTDKQVDKFVNSFKRSTPAMQRFAERKFEVLLEEREDEINKKEAEIQKLETANSKLQLEVDHLSSFLTSFVDVSSTISSEVQETVPSKHFLNEEIKQLQNLRKQVENANGNEQACEFYKNLEIIVRYIEEHADDIISAGIKNNKAGGKRQKSSIKLEVGKDVSLPEKMQNLVCSVSGFMDDLEHFPSVPTDMIRTELQKVHSHAKNMADDVTLVQNKLKQKRKVETEVLSLLHNLKETWRLERELKEKQHHINDLNKQGHLMRKKAGFKRKALNEIQLNLNQKKLQLSEVQKAIETRIKSADVRMHHLLRLLPDDGSETDSNPDSESLGTCTPYTENLSLSGTFSRVKQNGEPYTLKSSHTTPRATSLSPDKSDGLKSSMDKSDSSKSSPKHTADGSSGVVKRGEANKENKSSEISSTTSTVGQPYKNRLTIPNQRASRTVVATRKIQISGSHTHTSNEAKQTASTNPTRNNNNNVKQENVVISDVNNSSEGSPRKVPAKRQYESSSESDSQPNSAGVRHSHQPWPGATGEQPSPKRSPRHQKLAKKAEWEESEDDDDDEEDDEEEEDEVLEIRDVVSKEPTRVDMGSRAAQTGASSSNSNPTLVTSSTGQNQRYQYVLKGRTPPAKTGMSREEYYRYRYPGGGAGGVGPMPMTIGSYQRSPHKEIPSSGGGAVIRQTSNTNSVYKQSDDGGDPSSPVNSKRPAFRTYLNTKRVEPVFKLPGDR